MPLVIRCFCGDAPARAFISGIKYHNGKHGCPRCDALSNNSPKSIFVGNPRTDETFARRDHWQHHNKDYLHNGTILETMGFKMVTQIPIDSMHLCDSGVVKNCLQLICETLLLGLKYLEMSQLLVEVVQINPVYYFTILLTKLANSNKMLKNKLKI